MRDPATYSAAPPPLEALDLDRLDTPAMLVDLPAADRNIERMLSRFRGTPIGVRPHLKTVKSPEFARRLLEAGATGVCVAKLSEAEVMSAAGIDDILITTEIVGTPKLDRLVRLLYRHPRVRLVVDGVEGAEALQGALGAAGLVVEVLLELDVGQRRCGVLPGEPVLALAAHLATLPALRLVGVQGYEGHLQQLEGAERERRCREALASLADSAQALCAAGHDVRVVSTAGTGTAAIAQRCPGITEVQPGSFVFMDTSYRRALGAEFEPALSILTTVISRPRPGEAVVDAGLKSLSTDSGFAEPKSLPGVSYRPAGDEHGILAWSAAPVGQPEPRVGDRIELIPSHIDTTINLHDAYHVTSSGRLVATWPVSARGKVQ
ncbi:MAG TPA: DSD1 family PLP-dependent enzyme [Polyangiaceae bacterium]|nr:DSD1 family PLP-dependent enzyme [Polyangiaceae bacterium]